MSWLFPDFDAACRICGTSPCVVVGGHKQPDTELCGWHFFNNREKADWETWNDEQDTEE